MNPSDREQQTVSSSGESPAVEVSIQGVTDEAPLSTDFGNYELLEEVGRGGMGVVYKARQKDLDRFVAIKVILAGRLATPEQVQHFREEARAAAQLQHPNVVHIYEAGEVHGNHFFAMEYIAGQSLAEVVHGQRLEFETSAELVSTVARAVAHLHMHDIVHRDLKPRPTSCWTRPAAHG
ncbi:MAG: serine/threonine-protein kinase [Kiritimatiellaeota bacterium]|nr:serine/threonine-protein kinase [Kiritimatiellota bacterium]